LFLGGGGYIFPRFLQARWPGSAIEVAEIDPAVTNADMEAFGLESDNVDVSGSDGSEDAIAITDVSPHGDPEDPATLDPATLDSAPGASGDAELSGHDPPRRGRSKSITSTRATTSTTSWRRSVPGTDSSRSISFTAMPSTTTRCRST
jgi:hypothetical protein